MNKRPTYSELIEKNLINNPDWLLFIEGNGPMPDQHPDVLRVIAPFFFYMGAFNHAREMSGKLSVYLEERASKAKLESYKASELFESALHRSLAQREDEARKLWHAAAEKRRQIPDEILLKQRRAHLWVYEAYALTKLGRYDEISEPAQKGFAGINKGKATYKAPHKNSRVYGLVDVLINLSIYKIEPNDENKKRAQKALSFYKKENQRYGRLGYNIIFDLQFSYPDVFEPILPSEDPNED